MSSCDTYGTQCLDTGNQLQASNVAYDNTVTGGNCAHVQCYLEFVGSSLDNLNAGLSLHAGNLDNPHQSTVANLSDTAIANPIDGQVATYQNGSWVNANPVTGVTDHLLLTNIGTNSHVVIDEHIANLANPHLVTAAQVGAEPENANIQAHIADMANPHNTHTGFKNVLINGNLRINQRGFDGDWTITETEYGYDRWWRNGTRMAQSIEDSNLVSGVTYTLSWTGGGTAQINLGNASDEAASPITITALDIGTSFTSHVRVPHTTSTNIQLERGTEQTNFEVRNIQQELAMCQRFYEVMEWTSTTPAQSNIGSWAVTKRIVPGISSTASTYTANGTTGFRQDVDVAYQDETIIADAEL